MGKISQNSRREFIKKLGGTSVLLASGSTLVADPAVDTRIIPELEKKVSPNDKVRIACIGMGIQGFSDTNTALQVPGVEMVAAADCYDGRLKRAKEVYGNQVFTTKDYQEILDRNDVDAVIIATPDHWHEQMSIDALNKGKAVYCEKPMVKHIDEGHNMIKHQQKTKKILQVGSQYVSNLIYRQAKQLYESGEIGELNFAEAYFDRQSAMGAWQYSIPPDASKETIAWERFLGNAPKVPFDPVRFFRWRNYQDYGTGVSGDLFVHMFSGLHQILNSQGPTKIMSTGGLRYWKDGRDVEDITMGLYDYPKTEQHPAFNLSLRVNMADGSGGGSKIRLVGSDGEIVLGGDGLTVRRRRMKAAPGYTVNTFDEATQKAFLEEYHKKYKEDYSMLDEPEELQYKVPNGYPGMHYDHFYSFFATIREGKPNVEDVVFGLRAAGPALATNMSLREERVVKWDPAKMRTLTA